MASQRPIRLLLVAGALALALSACGRRGALEPPPSATAPAAQPEAAQPAAGPIPGSPVGQARRRPGPIVPGNDPFILDAIL
jgi:predicted small lipoprotein YifL